MHTQIFCWIEAVVCSSHQSTHQVFDRSSLLLYLWLQQALYLACGDGWSQAVLVAHASHLGKGTRAQCTHNPCCSQAGIGQLSHNLCTLPGPQLLYNAYANRKCTYRPATQTLCLLIPTVNRTFQWKAVDSKNTPLFERLYTMRIVRYTLQNGMKNCRFAKLVPCANIHWWLLSW